MSTNEETEHQKDINDINKENTETDSRKSDFDEITKPSSVVEIERITDNTLKKINTTSSNEDEEDSNKKVSSIRTIFSIWNTMIGSSIVSIPYNVYNAGIIPTVILGLLFGFICFFTCNLYIKLSGNEKDFANVVSKYFK